jgi:hypothetical protein
MVANLVGGCVPFADIAARQPVDERENEDNHWYTVRSGPRVKPSSKRVLAKINFRP